MTIIVKNNKLTTLFLVMIWCTCQFRSSPGTRSNFTSTSSMPDFVILKMFRVIIHPQSAPDIKKSCMPPLHSKLDKWKKIVVHTY